MRNKHKENAALEAGEVDLIGGEYVAPIASEEIAQNARVNECRHPGRSRNDDPHPYVRRHAPRPR